MRKLSKLQTAAQRLAYLGGLLVTAWWVYSVLDCKARLEVFGDSEIFGVFEVAPLVIIIILTWGAVLAAIVMDKIAKLVGLILVLIGGAGAPICLGLLLSEYQPGMLDVLNPNEVIPYGVIAMVVNFGGYVLLTISGGLDLYALKTARVNR